MSFINSLALFAAAARVLAAVLDEVLADELGFVVELLANNACSPEPLPAEPEECAWCRRPPLLCTSVAICE